LGAGDDDGLGAGDDEGLGAGDDDGLGAGDEEGCRHESVQSTHNLLYCRAYLGTRGWCRCGGRFGSRSRSRFRARGRCWIDCGRGFLRGGDCRSSNACYSLGSSS
jgi:hypothetical protein